MKIILITNGLLKISYKLVLQGGLYNTKVGYMRIPAKKRDAPPSDYQSQEPGILIRYYYSLPVHHPLR